MFKQATRILTLAGLMVGLLSWPASGATRRSITLTFTNIPSLTDSVDWRGETREFAASQTSTTFERDGSSIAQNATNLYEQVTIYALDNPTPDLKWNSPTSMTFYFKPSEGTSATMALSPYTFGYLTTNDITSGGYAVRVPITVENNTQRTNVASGIVEALAYATNAILSTWASTSNLVTTTGDRTIVGTKLFAGPTIVSNTASIWYGGTVDGALLSNAVYTGTMVALTNGIWTNGFALTLTATNLTVYSNFVSRGFGTSTFQAGSAAWAFGDYAIAIGDNQTVDDYSIGIGNLLGSVGPYEILIGNLIESGWVNNIGLGYSIGLNASNSIVIGNSSTIATGDTNSIVIGHGLASTEPNQILLGSSTQNIRVPGYAEVEGGITNLDTIGTFSVGGLMDWPNVVYSTLGDSNNVIKPDGQSFLRLTGSPTATWNLISIQENGSSGRNVLVLNRTGYNMIVKHESGLESNPEFRISTPTAGDYEVPEKSFAWFYFDAQGDTWRMLGLGPGAGGLTTNVVGELLITNHSAAISLTTQNTWYPIEDAFDIVGPSSYTTASASEGRITNSIGGDSLAYAALSIDGTASSEFEVAFFKNGTEVEGGKIAFYISATTGARTVPLSKVLSMDPDDYIELRARCTTGASKTITVEHGQLGLVGTALGTAFQEHYLRIGTNSVNVGEEEVLVFVDSDQISSLSTNVPGTNFVQFNLNLATNFPVEMILAASDETTTITASADKVTIRAPFAFTLTEVRASLNVAQTSGSLFTIDVNESGTTVLSTALTIDNNETTSTTAATPAVISDNAIADDAEISIDVDTVGTGSPAGLKIQLKGYRSL